MQYLYIQAFLYILLFSKLSVAVEANLIWSDVCTLVPGWTTLSGLPGVQAARTDRQQKGRVTWDFPWRRDFNRFQGQIQSCYWSFQKSCYESGGPHCRFRIAAHLVAWTWTLETLPWSRIITNLDDSSATTANHHESSQIITDHYWSLHTDHCRSLIITRYHDQERRTWWNDQESRMSRMSRTSRMSRMRRMRSMRMRRTTLMRIWWEWRWRGWLW